MIYLDNSATTAIDEEVLDAMLPWLRGGYGNASSIHTVGRTARVAIEDARIEIADAMGAHPAELFFTSGGTESNNTVLKSCVHESLLVNRVVVSAIEHHAVLYPAEELKRMGTEVHILPTNSNGEVLSQALAPYNSPTTLVSIMHANNETGVIQNISALRNAVPNALFHTDAVQTFGKIPVDVTQLGVDFLSVSAHKIHGPKGVGGVFVKKGIDFKAHQQGGGQERNRRAGTEPVALIVGFQVAIRKAMLGLKESHAHMVKLRTLLEDLLTSNIPDIRINTPSRIHPEKTLPNILNVSFIDAEQLDGESLIQNMDVMGVAVSNGSACVSGSQQPSHVLVSMGLSNAESKAAIRFSLARTTTKENVVAAATICSEVVRKLRVATRN